jgi:hypothetical protein
MCQQIFFKKSLNDQFNELRTIRDDNFHAEGRTDRQTDKHDESNNNFSQVFERT